MKEPRGTALQALRFMLTLSFGDEGSDAERFLLEWQRTALDPAIAAKFAAFCLANPDEPELKAADGTVRKQHYGSGKQPWDMIKDFGWAPQFAAGNVLKYLRRTKEVEDSRRKAKWYFDELIKISNGPPGLGSAIAATVAKGLVNQLTREELDVLGVPSCFRPKPMEM